MTRSLLLLFPLLLTVFSLHASGNPKYISMPSTSEGLVIQNRHLLQVLTQCPVNFQVQNYTIITSECKGPQYPQNACCTAFVKFACPFAEQINDNTTDCSITMFNYINIYGRYPAGLFANECHGDDKGLPCPNSGSNTSSLASSESSDAGLHGSYHRVLWWMGTIVSSLVLFGVGFVN